MGHVTNDLYLRCAEFPPTSTLWSNVSSSGKSASMYVRCQHMGSNCVSALLTRNYVTQSMDKI